MRKARSKSAEVDEEPPPVLAGSPGCEANCPDCTVRCSVIQGMHEDNGECLADHLAAYRQIPSHANERALLASMDAFNTSARVSSEYREKKFGRPIKRLPMPNAGMISLAIH